MIKHRYMLITLVVAAGLIILPSIIDGSEISDLPGNSTLNEVKAKQLLDDENAPGIGTKQQHRIIARKKLARKLQQMTIPFVDELDRLPKILEDLKGPTNRTSRFFQSDNDTPKPYAKLLRVLLQIFWKDAWELLNKKKAVRDDEV